MESLPLIALERNVIAEKYDHSWLSKVNKFLHPKNIICLLKTKYVAPLIVDRFSGEPILRSFPPILDTGRTVVIVQIIFLRH